MYFVHLKSFSFYKLSQFNASSSFKHHFKSKNEWTYQYCVFWCMNQLNKKKFFNHFIFDFYIIDLFFPKKNWHETDCILSQSVLRFVCTNLKRSSPVIKAEWAIHNEGYTIHMNKHQWYTSHSLVIAETPLCIDLVQHTANYIAHNPIFYQCHIKVNEVLLQRINKI